MGNSSKPKAKIDPWEFGNNPNNPQHIREGAEQFSKGTVYKRVNENKLPMPERIKAFAQFGGDADGYRDTSGRAIADRMRELEGLMADQRSEYWRGLKAESLQANYRELVDVRNRHKTPQGELEQFSMDALRERMNENRPTKASAETATQFGINADRHMDGPDKAVTDRIHELQSLMGDRHSEYWRGPQAEALQQEYRDLVEERDRHKPRPGDLDFSPFTMVT